MFPGLSRESSPLTRDQLEKVGQAIVYMAGKIQPLYKTKLLKLLYLLDETSMKLAGFPMFGLEYKAWRMGPVSKEIYVDIDDGPYLLKNYIRVVRDSLGDRVEPISSFDDGEFSDRDIEIMEAVIGQYGAHNSQELVDITHDKDSLWSILVRENGLSESFEKEERNTSGVVLDLGRLVANDPRKSKVYEDYLEFIRTHKALSGE